MSVSSETKRNRLANESSPYLLLHANNPVDWYPWGEEAFERARTEDKPIFLSVGYSTCYWCHVMEREAFSNSEIAQQMNAGFVCIKLDREERPDIDEVYMAATQLLTQSGGWPNSVFLTPDLKPFFAGTYFPPEDRYGRPGFPRVLTALRQAWDERRPEVLQQAETIASVLTEHIGAGARPSTHLPDPGLADETQLALARRFDREWGGFGTAPKFPSPSNLFFLLERADRDAQAREMLVITLDLMARGGLQDQLAGGFHRYSTDREWLVPHFEKMLYDNAALASLYALAHPLDPEAGFAEVARRTLDFVLAELTAPEGGFLSAIDAETDGHEGAYYTWTREELKEILGPEFPLMASVYGFEGRPTFERDRYVLHLPVPLRERARLLGVAEDELKRMLEPGRKALLDARSRRPHPLVDDKILTDWNGLMIGAMARAGSALGEPRYTAAALRAAEFVLSKLADPETRRLLHAYREGQARIPALLDDYAFMVEGLLALHSATSEPRWLEDALRLVAEQDDRLWDADNGGYFAGPSDPRLLVRARSALDGAIASGNGMSVLNLLDLAERTGTRRFRERAAHLLRAFGHGMAQYPLAHVTLIRALARMAPDVKTAAVAEGAAETLDDTARAVLTAHGSVNDQVPGKWKPFMLDLEIKEGWHINAHPASDPSLAATVIEGEGGAVRDVRYPAGERYPADSSDAISVYRGTVRVEGEVEVKGDEQPKLRLTYQACDETRCLPVVSTIVSLV